MIPNPEDVFDVIRAVAIEQASSPDCGTCRCGHIQGAHVGRFGACTGRKRRDGRNNQVCDCPRFQGLNVSRQRQLERYGVALLVQLRDGGRDGRSTAAGHPSGSDGDGGLAERTAGRPEGPKHANRSHRPAKHPAEAGPAAGRRPGRRGLKRGRFTEVHEKKKKT